VQISASDHTGLGVVMKVLELLAQIVMSGFEVFVGADSPQENWFRQTETFREFIPFILSPHSSGHSGSHGIAGLAAE
jgi:hypothetical protein